MEPNSILLVVLLFLAAAALIVVAIRYRPIGVKILTALLSISLSTAGGIAVVNDYFGYYQTWSQLDADLSGSYHGFDTAPAADRHGAGAIERGRIESVTFAGALSHIARSGIVYLPPQYFQPAYAHIRFPVVELVHGSPGAPSRWIIQLKIADVANRLIGEHLMGPMILVMPAMMEGVKYEECVNAPGGAQDDTYITDDIRTDVLAKYRASTDPSEWGIGGYSSGGYCAVNLALRHPATFGAAAAMDGYFRPQDGPAAKALKHNAAVEQANDPLLAAQRLVTGVHPLPALWLSAGTGDASDYVAAQAFAAALHGVEQVTLYKEAGAGHNFDAWRPATPRMLAWMWAQIAPPSLRVDFPIAGPVRNSSFPAPGANPSEHSSGSPTRTPTSTPTRPIRPSTPARGSGPSRLSRAR